MYCRKCGADIGNAQYCPVCGAKQDDRSAEQTGFADEAKQRSYKYESAAQSSDHFEAAYTVNDFAQSGEFGGSTLTDRLMSAFKDPMFLAVTVLVTVEAALGSVGISAGSGKLHLSIGIFGILFAVGLWLIYGAVKSDNGSFISGLSFTSGVVKANKIVLWVVIIALLVAAVICFIAGPTLLNEFTMDDITIRLIDDLPPEAIDEIPEIINHDKFGHISNFMLIGLGIVFIITDALLLVINLCFVKKLHRFTKSLCDSVKTGTYQVTDVVPSKNWLIVTAVFGFLGAFGSVGTRGSLTDYFGITISSGNLVMSSVAAICGAVAAILASVLIRKYLID